MATEAPSEIMVWEIGRVRPYERNPKPHDAAAIAEAAASLREFGWTYPLLVDEGGVLLAGHRRLLAAKSLAMGKVPVIQKVGLTEGQKQAYRLADNKLAERTAWDADILQLELSDLTAAGVDLEITGFDEADLIELGKATAATKLNAPPEQRKLNDRAKAIKVVLFADELSEFEEAIRLTGIRNRGEAVREICRHYLATNNEKRQLDDHVKSLVTL